jgi:hypothetical protein
VAVGGPAAAHGKHVPGGPGTRGSGGRKALVGDRTGRCRGRCGQLGGELGRGGGCGLCGRSDRRPGGRRAASQRRSGQQHRGQQHGDDQALGHAVLLGSRPILARPAGCAAGQPARSSCYAGAPEPARRASPIKLPGTTASTRGIHRSGAVGWPVLGSPAPAAREQGCRRKHQQITPLSRPPLRGSGFDHTLEASR